MNVLVTLNSGQGAGLGPNFLVYSDVGTLSYNTTLVDLLAGVELTFEDTATIILIESLGVCLNILPLPIIPVPITTTTTTSTYEDCELFFYITDVTDSLIEYEITSNRFPVTVQLYSGVTLIDTNIHLSDGTYSFSGVFSDDYTITFTDSCGVTVSTIISIGCDCPVGYTAVGDGCRLIETTSATIPTFPTTLTHMTYSYYTWKGALLFSDYAVDGTGTIQTKFTSNWWRNNVLTTTAGPLNRTGVWASTTTSNQDVGFTFCANIVETKTYYVGIASDNYVYLKVNGETKFTQDLTAIRDSVYAQGEVYEIHQDRISWQYWIIYPIVLEAGKNIIEVVGHNISSIAAVGCEIYEAADPLTIGTWTSYEDMGTSLLFSSKDEIGNETQLGSLGYGYSCPEGYSLVLCDGSPYCRKITEVPCTGDTTTTTTTIIPITTTTTSTSIITTTTTTTAVITTTTTSSSTTSTTSSTTTTTSTTIPCNVQYTIDDISEYTTTTTSTTSSISTTTTSTTLAEAPTPYITTRTASYTASPGGTGCDEADYPVSLVQTTNFIPTSLVSTFFSGLTYEDLEYVKIVSRSVTGEDMNDLEYNGAPLTGGEYLINNGTSSWEHGFLNKVSKYFKCDTDVFEDYTRIYLSFKFYGYEETTTSISFIITTNTTNCICDTTTTTTTIII